MPIEDITPTREAFEQVNWQAVITGSASPDCVTYQPLFFQRAREAHHVEDATGWAVFMLLGFVTSTQLYLDGPMPPLSSVSDQLTDAHLDVLRDIVEGIADPELQARIADLLVLRRREYQMARLAIEAYLHAAEALEDPVTWPPCLTRLERALHLAASFGGSNHPSWGAVLAQLTTWLDKYHPTEEGLFCAELMRLLFDQREGDPATYAPLAEEIARRIEASEVPFKWRFARRYWEMKAGWHHRMGDAESQQAAMRQAAERYVWEADEATRLPLERHPYALAAALIQEAIEALRQFPHTQERREELHRLLVDYQARSTQEWTTHSTTFDIARFVEAAQRQVSGLALYEALVSLALLHPLVRVAEMRQEVERLFQEQPLFFFLWSPTVYNREGRVVEQHSPAFDGGTLSDEALRVMMYRQAAQRQGLIAQAFLDPAREQVLREHGVRLADLVEITVYTPFVPPGREMIVARGLHAGLLGDPLVAAHLLIPQIEHAVRHLLREQGVITSRLDDRFEQPEYYLHHTLKEPRFAEPLIASLGEDVVFNLRCLLVEHSGHNLRNELAHGFLAHQDFFAFPVVYLWWLTLRLCILPLLPPSASHTP